MKKMDNVLNILTAMTYRGIGNAWISKNLRTEQTLEYIVGLLNMKGLDITEYSFKEKKEDIRNMLNSLYIECEEFRVTTIGDDDFPEFRGNIKKNAEQPVVLFYKGSLELLQQNNKNIAVIGLLTPTKEIDQRERHIVKSLVKQGITIVSGLANGCDSIAHDECLKNNGNTIAILPSPLNQVLPKSNLPLAREILNNGGLLVTEYCTDISSKFELSKRYIDRDRLQALYSDCVLLTASYKENDEGLDSGSRHAMGKAKDYGVARAVMYDETMDIGNNMFDLNRQIFKDNGVIIVKEDIEKLLDKVYNNTISQQSILF